MFRYLNMVLGKNLIGSLENVAKNPPFARYVVLEENIIGPS